MNKLSSQPSADPAKEPKSIRGLVCPQCGCQHFEVLYTRRAYGAKLLRRRACRHCGRRVTTSETCLG